MLGIYEVVLDPPAGGGRNIWVRGESSAEPYIPCYIPRRLKGGEPAYRQAGAAGRDDRKRVQNQEIIETTLR